jgi:drug/metabolite transporter (DMT)-like permease
LNRGERAQTSIADDAGDVLTQAPHDSSDAAPDASSSDVAAAAAEHAGASDLSHAWAPSVAASAALWPGLLLASAGAIGFSGKAIIAKLAYRHGVDAITLVAYRMLFALPLFALLALWASRGREPLARRDWVLIAGLGFTGYYLASTLDFIGLQYVSASLERLILYLNPTLVLAIGAIAFGRRIVPGQMVALAVSYLGVLVVFGHEITHAGPNALLGAVLVFGSAISYALYLVYSGEEVRRIGALRLTGLASLVACALCIVQFAVLRPWSALAVAPEVIGLSVLNATLCTFAPVVMVMLAIERIGAPLVAQTGMIGPLSTLAMSVVLLGEPVTAWLLLGTALVLAGIGLLARQPRG